MGKRSKIWCRMCASVLVRHRLIRQQYQPILSQIVTGHLRQKQKKMVYS